MLSLLVLLLTGAPSQELPADYPHAWRGPGERIGHVFPELTVSAPGVGSRTEAGIGALMPWADRLWVMGYVAHKRGSGIGLYELRPDLSWRLHPASVTGTFANRMVHWESEQAFIGPYAIDAEGNVRVIEALKGERLTAIARHLERPRELAYVLSMEGPLYELDVRTLEATKLCDLARELALPEGAQPHFKGMFSAQGRLVVANNTYDEREYLGQRSAGRLASWDGQGPWDVLERNPFVEVSGKTSPGPAATYGDTLYALGWDRLSVVLRVLHGGEWKRYRLPFGSHAWEHTWNTEWMRIREVQTERYLMDAFGIFYDLSALTYGGHVWGLRPVASHLRVVPDLVFWRGMLVLAGDQTDNAVGQPQSGLWFGDVDDLWSWGAPAGWGALWRDTPLEAGERSDPFLMTGFGAATLHLSHGEPGLVSFAIEVDALGDGDWHVLETLELGGHGYRAYVFPVGFGAHWLRVRALDACTATAALHYR